MPGLCEGHVTQRTVTGRGSDTEMGAAVGGDVWTLETHEPGIKYILAVSSSIKMSSVSTSYYVTM